MPMWIDPPRWPAHGRLWAHLISDTSLAELHSFAEQAGIPRRSFEGDHYDVPAERYQHLIALGAQPISGQELVRRLSASGLRFRKRRGERPLARFVDGSPVVPFRHTLDIIGSTREPPASSGAAVVTVSDPAGRLVLVLSEGREIWTPPGGKRDLGETVRQAAVREVAEECGLVVAPEELTPVGYERITIAPGDERPPWDAGDNHIAVFGWQVPTSSIEWPLSRQAADIRAVEWVTQAEARSRSSLQPWWILVERWLERVGPER